MTPLARLSNDMVLKSPTSSKGRNQKDRIMSSPQSVLSERSGREDKTSHESTTRVGARSRRIIVSNELPTVREMVDAQFRLDKQYGVAGYEISNYDGVVDRIFRKA